jgi:Dolichyl-phosphate-mannose-protein mannosyltransferase
VGSTVIVASAPEVSVLAPVRGLTRGRRRKTANILLPALLAVALVRLWIMPMGSSFWIDEMATVFVVGHPHDPSLAVAPQVPDSIYYVLPRLSVRLFGHSEAAYRLPSLLLMGLALFLIARLAARLLFPDAAWFVTFACLGLAGFNTQAADARPYALGTCMIAATLWCLVEWLDRQRSRDALLFIVCGSLLWRVSLVFWPAYVVFAVYAAVRLARRDTQVSWRRVAAAFAVLGALLAPVMLDALALNHHASAHVIVPLPNGRALMDGLKLGLVVTCCAGAALAGRWLGWPHARVPFSRSAVVLMFAWWLSQPLGLFAYSRVTGNSVFVARYLAIGLPAVALVATSAAALFIPRPYWKTLSLALGTGVLLLLGQWGRLWPAHTESDWRGAAESMNTALAPGTPVICPSPFVEAKEPAWRPDYPLPGFLFAHLSVYRIAGRPYLFPFKDSPAADRYAAELAAGALRAAGRFAIYGGDRAALFWLNWFRARPEFAGWSIRGIGPAGDVDAIEFSRPDYRSGVKTSATASGGWPGKNVLTSIVSPGE